MTWEEYGRRSVQWPYVLRFDSRQGSLLYYGARHTYGPHDAQIEQIEALWACFRPTVAFNEGGNPPIEVSRDAAIEKHGEAGLIRFLAARDDVPVVSLDPDRAEGVAHLRRSFSAVDVKLFFVLRAAAQTAERRGPGAVDAELERILPIFNRAPGLGGHPQTLAEVSAAFARKLPNAQGYRSTPLAWFDPTRPDTFLNRMSRADSDFRDGAIVGRLSRAVADGQRVFAVIGGTHVVMQEDLLAFLLGAPARRPTNSCD